MAAANMSPVALTSQVDGVTGELHREKAEGVEASKRAAEAAAAAGAKMQQLEADLQAKEAEIKSNLANIDSTATELVACSSGVQNLSWPFRAWVLMVAEKNPKKMPNRAGNKRDGMHQSCRASIPTEQ
eukprot:scaffold119358_cov22-Tisochrysis_lutea.AAC.1